MSFKFSREFYDTEEAHRLRSGILFEIKQLLGEGELALLADIKDGVVAGDAPIVKKTKRTPREPKTSVSKN